MKEITPLIIRLADFYGLQIEDAEDDSFWVGGRWKKLGRARWSIVDSQHNAQFYWHSNETEDEFLEELRFYFKDLDRERLEQWKKGAMQVLDKWEKVWVAAGSPGTFGQSKADAVLKFIQANAQEHPAREKDFEK